MATKALTKKIITDLEKYITQTTSLKIACGCAGVPSSTFYVWQKAAKEIEEEGKDESDLTKDELLLLEFLERIDLAKAKSCKPATRVRVFKRDGEVVTWSLYDGEDGSPIALEQPFALKEIPVVAVHSSPVVASGELMAAPPLIDLAYGNVQHWQEKSDQLNILRVARIPVLFASGVADDASIAIGAEYAIKGDIGADLKYVEHSGAAIGAGRDSIRDLEMQMQSYGLDMLENTGVAETAQGRTLRAGETNNRVAMTTLNLSSAMSKGFGWLAYFNRLPDAEFHVDINTDYGVTSDAQVLSTLTTMRTMGDISREDYLQEMKRHSVLGNEFNLADNEDRLSVELA